MIDVLVVTTALAAPGGAGGRCSPLFPAGVGGGGAGRSPAPSLSSAGSTE